MKLELDTLHSVNSLENLEKQKQNFTNIIALWSHDYINEAELKKKIMKEKIHIHMKGFQMKRYCTTT